MRCMLLYIYISIREVLFLDDYKENNGIEPVPEEETVSAGDTPAEETVPENNDQFEENPDTVEDCAEDTEQDGILITPQDDTQEESTEEMCILCGEKPADKSFGEDYDLCADCRKSLIKSPMRFSGVLAIILLIGIGFWGLIFTASQAGTLTAILEGEEYAAQNKLYSAIESYSSGGNIGWKTAKRLIEAYNTSGYLSGINSAVEGYFYDATAVEEGEKLTFADKIGKVNLNLPWNKDVKEIYANYNEAMEAYQKYYAYLAEYDEQLYYGSITQDQVPYDTVLAQYEAAKNETDKPIDLAFINYCEYYLAYMAGKSTDVQYGYLSKVKELAPEYEWLYLTPLTEMNVLLGNFDEALAGCEALEKTNADDVYGQYYRTQVLRMQGDYSAALASAEEMIADYESTGFYYAYFEAAKTAFLMKDYEKAKEYAYVCYGDGSGAYLNEQTVNLYGLICKASGDDEGYNGVVEFLKAYELEISPTINEYMSGKITAEEMFNGREVAFE